jgi:hypothetical protein
MGENSPNLDTLTAIKSGLDVIKQDRTYLSSFSASKMDVGHRWLFKRPSEFIRLVKTLATNTPCICVQPIVGLFIPRGERRRECSSPGAKVET